MSRFSSPPGDTRPAHTNIHWDHEFETLRREKLFKEPPKDHTAYPFLQDAINPHIESFDAILEEGGLLPHALEDIGSKTYLDGHDRSNGLGKNQLRVQLKQIYVNKSYLSQYNKFSTKNREIMPSECRERQCTYRGKLIARLEYQVNGEEPVEFYRELGQLPLMVKSNRCHLEGLPPAKLVEQKEEAEELGGYFICNGIEKMIRLLLVNRRNFPMAIARPTFTSRGPAYTAYGVLIRCVRPDQTSQTNVIHYLNDGSVIFRFSWKKNEYQIPVVMILKALIETNDREIFEGLAGTAGSKGAEDSFLTDRVELLLRSHKAYHLFTRKSTRSYLGEKFRPVLGVPPTTSAYDAGTEFLRRVVLVHLGNVHVTTSQDLDKFQMLIFMVRKLYALVAGDCAVDNPDAVQNQEILLGGFLYGMIIKERIEDWLQVGVGSALRDWLQKSESNNFSSPGFLRDWPVKILGKTNENIGSTLEYFISTGNLVSSTGLDLQQTSGFVVVAEKLNFLRFLSHFRMVHRGSFFAQLKTTTVRKLLPESWGFLCPVHTPDGAPCGLLNHLAHKCIIVTRASKVEALPHLVTKLGVVGSGSASTDECVVVQLDGRVLGWCTPKQALIISNCLRHWKVEGKNSVPKDLEIGYIPNSKGGQYPGIYLASAPSRMIRPVRYLPLDKEDMVGTLEQPFMSIAVQQVEIMPGEHTHVEYDPTHILSILANMTPFSDFNQSPRNMYQCQMGKQTMGTPSTALRYRTDNKLYRLQTGQTPIVRSPLHNSYGFDNFPNGTNAVVAVISYTSYDMDDAMIINKSAHERGFGHGTIYKTKKYDINDGLRTSRSASNVERHFGFAPGSIVKPRWKSMIDEDGLPFIGRCVREGDYLYAWHTVKNDGRGNFHNHDQLTQYVKYKESETAFIEEVRILGSEMGNMPNQVISIKFRVPRSPVIGDKFSSRHGQKGVCSQKWPNIDMPFSESGMQPDIIINPHAFPSRMTIGMFIESLAGKAGALHGLAQESTPFRFDEAHTAGDYFGHQLMKAGYNYYGNEPMYSGITGEEFAADIYLGVVYYQRLRHMVNDKYQVRTTGTIAHCTGQPIKGRQRGGGIRVGEMERDALLAHGAAFLLQDRLFNCSDYKRSWVCKGCGSFLAVQATTSPFAHRVRGTGVWRCRRCAVRVDGAAEAAAKGMIWVDGEGQRWVGGEDTTVVAVPAVLRYLDVELAAMGIKLKYGFER